MDFFNQIKELKFNELGDNRGHLVVIEELRDIPFQIKRIFYIYGSDNDAIRGQHANRESEFVLINVSGQCKVSVKDQNGNEKIFCLDKPQYGLYLPKMVWKEMFGFSEDSVLLVLTNTLYNSNEYIRNFEEYVKEYK